MFWNTEKGALHSALLLVKIHGSERNNMVALLVSCYIFCPTPPHLTLEASCLTKTTKSSNVRKQIERNCETITCRLIEKDNNSLDLHTRHFFVLSQSRLIKLGIQSPSLEGEC